MPRQKRKPPSSRSVGFADIDDDADEARGRTSHEQSDSFQGRGPVGGYRQMEDIAEVHLAASTKPEGSISQDIDDGEDAHDDDQANLLRRAAAPISSSVARPRASESSSHQQCSTDERVGALEQLSTTVPTHQQQQQQREEEEEEEEAARDDADSASLAPSSSHESCSSSAPPPRMASSRTIGTPSTIRKKDLLASRRNRLPATNGAGATPLIAPSFSRLSSRSSSRMSLRSNPTPQKKSSKK